MSFDMENEIYHLKLEEIVPNKYQPREVFDESSLKELTKSIEQHGVIQPIIVRKKDDKYEVIDGERRYKAAIKAGLLRIPAIVRSYNDNECVRISLIDNLQRQDFSPIEEAKMYKRILENEGMTQDELANNIGKSQSAVANKLRLLNLPLEIQESLLKQEISERHARSLLTVKDPQIQIDLLKKIIEKRMTVRELDSEIKNMSNMFIPEEYRNNNISSNQINNEPGMFVTNNVISNNVQPTGNRFINFDQPISNNVSSNNLAFMNNKEDSSNFIPQNDPFVTPINDPREFGIDNNKFNSDNNLDNFNNHPNMFIPPINDDTTSNKPNNGNPFLTSDNYIPPISTENNNQSTGNPFSDIRMNTSRNNVNSSTPFFIENKELSGNNLSENTVDVNKEDTNYSNINSQENNNDFYIPSVPFNNENNSINNPFINVEPNNNIIENQIDNGENSGNVYSKSLDNDNNQNVDSEFNDSPSVFNINDYKLPGNVEEPSNDNNQFIIPSINSFNVSGDQSISENDYKYVEDNPNYLSVDNPKGVETVEDIINVLRATLDKIKNGKLRVDTEEIDFDDLYQITIKIDKKGDF